MATTDKTPTTSPAPELTAKKDVKSLFEKPEIANRIKAILDKNAPQFVTSVIQLVNSSNDLAECEPMSVINSAMVATTLNLPLNNNLGLAYIIPYNNRIKGRNGQPDRWEKVAQFQLGYRGLKLLAQNTGRFLLLNETDVREGEIAGRDRLTGEITFNWITDDAEREKKPVIGYLSFLKLTNGFSSTLYMTNEELETHARKYSKVYKSDGTGGGLWKTDRPAMAIKTVCKLNIYRNAVLSIIDNSLSTAIKADQAIISDVDNAGVPSFNYADNPTENAEFEVVNETPADKAKKAESATMAKLNLE